MEDMIYKIINKLKLYLFGKRKEEFPSNYTTDIKKTKTQNIRRTYQYQKFKRTVRKTITQECWNCDSKESLQIHHIVSIKENPGLATDIKNVIMLCQECHSQFHTDCQESQNEIEKNNNNDNKDPIESLGITINQLKKQKKQLNSKLNSEIAELEFKRAKILESGGEFEKALKCYSRAINFDKKQEYKEALKDIQKLISLKEDNG